MTHPAVIRSITGSKKRTDIELTDKPYDTLKALAADEKDGFVRSLFHSDTDYNHFINGTSQIDKEASSFALMDGSEVKQELEFYEPYSEQITDLKIHDKDELTFVVAVSMVVGH